MKAKPTHWLRLAVLALLAMLLALPVQAQGGQSVAPQAEPVAIEMVPASRFAVVGDTFRIQVMVRSGAQPIYGAQVFINFNPKRLECLEVIPGGPLTDIFPLPDGAIDNVKGQVNYAAGKLLGDAASGSFELVTLRMRALAATSSTPLTYAVDKPRITTVVGGDGLRYPLQLLEGQVSIAASANTVRLPLILRN